MVCRAIKNNDTTYMSKYLFAEIKKVKKAITNSNLLVLLDYDGTIVPIVKTPKDASLPEKTKELLQKLSKYSRVKLGIISGRSLSDIKKMVGINSLIYAGNHGIEWEIEGRKGKLRKLQFDDANLAKLRKELNVISGKFRGAILEDKKYILSVHYRLVKKEMLESFRKYLKYLLAPYKKNGSLRMTRGKKVYEIKLNLNWNKGDFVKFLKEEYFKKKYQQIVYIGDDTTDEDVFNNFKEAITVKVGKSKTAGNYYVRNTTEVLEFLKFIEQNVQR